MPNHFHFLLRQEKDKGITKFLANFSNSYTKYFNTRHKRVGPLLQGTFKSVWVETDEQLMHLSRYIHLNPLNSHIVKEDQIDYYEWSSFPEYLKCNNQYIVDTDLILNHFKNKEDYRSFIHDYIGYQKDISKIEHLIQEE